MPIIENWQVVEERWLRLPSDGDPVTLPAAQPLLMTLTQWLALRDVLTERQGPLGVLLQADDEVELLAPDLPRLSLIVLHFAAFTDGRGYSQARLLREELGYSGEIRAEGEILPDQAAVMSQVGINSYALSDRVDVEQFCEVARATLELIGAARTVHR